MPFWPNVSAREIMTEAQTWNARHAQSISAQAPPSTNDRSPERRLRIGYVSPDFQTHVQSLFTIPLLQNHDHGKFEIFCYSSADKASQETARIRGYADVWREGAALDDAALAEQIRRDRIDVAIGQRLPVDLEYLALAMQCGLRREHLGNGPPRNLVALDARRVRGP